MLRAGDEVLAAILFLVFEAIVFLIVALYIDAVSPSEFGISKPWNFPFLELRAMLSAKARQRRNSKLALGNTSSDNLDPKMLELEDADVKAERTRVDENGYDPKCPLVMKHMRKVYPPRAGLGPKIAVRDVSLAVEEGVVFGLLGPNGAGRGQS